MKILSCEFNIDTACVELRLSDGTMISIDCTAVENEVADNMYQRSGLDYLIYPGCADTQACFEESSQVGQCSALGYRGCQIDLPALF